MIKQIVFIFSESVFIENGFVVWVIIKIGVSFVFFYKFANHSIANRFILNRLVFIVEQIPELYPAIRIFREERMKRMIVEIPATLYFVKFQSPIYLTKTATIEFIEIMDVASVSPQF